MQRVFKWVFMLNKRLYKKLSFVVLLALIPLCVGVFSLVAKQDSGFVHIVLAQTEAQDEVSAKVIEELMAEDTMIRFTRVDGATAALEAVKTGQADEAWVFPANTKGEIDDFIDGERHNVVTVITREQTVALRLSREKLTAVLYKYCAKACYIDYARANLPSLDTLTDQELIRYFDEVRVDEELFVFGDPADRLGTDGQSNTNYLTSPIRGLLGIVAVLCGMAATMYHMQDMQHGTFSWVREDRRLLVALGSVMIAVLNVTVVIWISLCVGRLAANVLWELLCLIVYAVCCALFCLMLRELVYNLSLYAVSIPLLTVTMIAVCPVFFDLRNIPYLRLLFPPTYYVNAVYDRSYLVYMLGYSLACAAILLAVRVLLRRRSVQ